MIQDIYGHKLDIAYRACQVCEDDAVLYFQDERFACIELAEDGLRLPTAKELGCVQESLLYAFVLDGRPVFLVPSWKSGTEGPIGAEAPIGTEGSIDAKAFSLPATCSWHDASELRSLEPDWLAFAILTGLHLFHWYRSSRFCGRCACAMEHSKTERAMVCPACANTVYPRINPAVIVGVVSGDRIVMTRYAGRAYKGHALVAGFIEPGETAEQCVAREVGEELGLSVKNIRYAASQPWGLVDDLLLGYFCEVDGSDKLHLDKNELESAEWVDRKDVEKPPHTRTLTNHMIELFRQGREPR